MLFSLWLKSMAANCQVFLPSLKPRYFLSLGRRGCISMCSVSQCLLFRKVLVGPLLLNGGHPKPFLNIEFVECQEVEDHSILEWVLLVWGKGCLKALDCCLYNDFTGSWHLCKWWVISREDYQSWASSLLSLLYSLWSKERDTYIEKGKNQWKVGIWSPEGWSGFGSAFPCELQA